ncbi:hypothetical protein E2562_000366 [Oryza meyeriana var. granulata]|uniref:Uncharacterized protein n=1 Tax=Oryza meyeriana var. granulata TaxID=110450 RepID=A0A6G1CDD7_9ORYZ|nr:hypothetical protein E2562_000366 [Oryza meyeriana var. granulata]
MPGISQLEKVSAGKSELLLDRRRIKPEIALFHRVFVHQGLGWFFRSVRTDQKVKMANVNICTSTGRIPNSLKKDSNNDHYNVNSF